MSKAKGKDQEIAEPPKMKKAFYGTHVKETKVVGYCRYHHLNLTGQMIKTRECLKRNCPHLDKHTEHAYWSKDKMPSINKERNKIVQRNMESKLKPKQQEKGTKYVHKEKEKEK